MSTELLALLVFTISCINLVLFRKLEEVNFFLKMLFTLAVDVIIIVASAYTFVNFPEVQESLTFVLEYFY